MIDKILSFSFRLAYSIIFLIVMVFVIQKIIILNYSCIKTIKYSLGDIDNKFNLTKTELLTSLSDSQKFWEDYAQRDLFQYDPNSSFRVNLIYDERQKRLDDIRNDKEGISDNKFIIEKELKEINKRRDALKTNQDNFQVELKKYNNKMEKLNNDIRIYNSGGSGDPQEFKSRRVKLTVELSKLKKREKELFSISSQLNRDYQEYNKKVANFNANVKNFNKKYGQKMQFDQGQEGRGKIDLFYFENEDDLRAVIIHEIGHALGLKHVSNPKSIMYYLLKEQDKKNIHLTEEDKEEFERVCKLKDKNFSIFARIYQKTLIVTDYITPYLELIKLYSNPYSSPLL